MIPLFLLWRSLAYVHLYDVSFPAILGWKCENKVNGHFDPNTLYRYVSISLGALSLRTSPQTLIVDSDQKE